MKSRRWTKRREEKIASCAKRLTQVIRHVVVQKLFAKHATFQDMSGKFVPT